MAFSANSRWATITITGRSKTLASQSHILQILLATALIGAALELCSPVAGAQEPDKDQYHLFNPTPRHLMRPMSTDRPDATESPHTVDAGHFQVELSFAEYARGGGVDQFSVLPVNLKVGLTNRADLQLVVEPWVRLDADELGAVEGFGDTQVRLKINLWGNDGGPFALAVMPFVQFPTGDDDLSTGRLEGGLIVPAAFELPAGFGLGVQAEVDFLRDAENADYGVAFVHTAALGRDISGPLAGYIEYIGIASDDLGADYEAYGAAGLTLGASDDLQLDIGVNVGLTDAAADFVVFSGLSLRL